MAKLNASPSRRRLAALSLALITLARAASATEPDEAGKKHARELMARGRQERASADLPGALRDFSEADAIMHVPSTGLELARVLNELGRSAEALTEANAVAALAVAAAEPAAFATARQGAKDLARELESEVPLLHVSVAPDRATRLTLDSKALDLKDALTGVRVDVGRHVLTATQAGKTQRRVVDLGEGSSIDINLDFSTPPPAQARIQEQSGQPQRTSPATYAAYSLAGVALAGIGTGVGLRVWADQRNGQLERTCAPSCGAAQVDSLRRTYVASNITAGIGIGAGLTALVVYFATPKSNGARDRRAQASLTIDTTPASAGLGLAGSF